MEKLKIKYCGSWPDNSGYGDANRNFIASLFCNGVDLTTESVTQTLQTVPTGWIGQLCSFLEGRDIDYKIKFIHLTPDLYPKYMEKGKYHIGHLFFEADKLPKEWVEPCNQMQEIWTASESQAQMIKASGVTVPIKWFPQPLDVTPATLPLKPFTIPNFQGVRFYSIFQWIERKDPQSLLTTYWKTFEGKDDVVLILKTYLFSYSDSDFTKIKDEISRWKKGLKLKHYPKVLLVKELWPTPKMWKFHKSADIYVSTSHQEGWNRPAVEASLIGNPIIAMEKTGFADYFPKDVYYPIPATPSKVTEVSTIPWYKSDQKWFDIDKQKLAVAMLECYNSLKSARARGKLAQDYVTENFNFFAVGRQMVARLEEIQKSL